MLRPFICRSSDQAKEWGTVAALQICCLELQLQAEPIEKCNCIRSWFNRGCMLVCKYFPNYIWDVCLGWFFMQWWRAFWTWLVTLLTSYSMVYATVRRSWRLQIAEDGSWNGAYLEWAKVLLYTWDILYNLRTCSIIDEFHVFAEAFVYFCGCSRMFYKWDDNLWHFYVIKTVKRVNWNELYW